MLVCILKIALYYVTKIQNNEATCFSPNSYLEVEPRPGCGSREALFNYLFLDQEENFISTKIKEE